MTSTQLAALKAELETDPLSLGYAPFVASGSMQPLADLLNEVRATITVAQREVPVADFIEAIDPVEFAGLAQAALLRLTVFTQRDMVPIRGDQARAILRDIFPASPGTTRANLVALRNRTGSRAEQLFGVGTTVSYQDCAAALRS